MKYIVILFVSFVYMTLSGCSQLADTDTNDSGTTLSGEMATSSSTQEVKNESLQGNITSGAWISGAKYTILISGDYIIYGGFFSIAIPKGLISREYNNTTIEWFSLTDTPHERFLTLTVVDGNGRRKNLDNQDKCTLDKYQEGVVSKKIVTKIIQGHTIYLTNLIFHVEEAPEINVSERTWKVSDLCFVNNDFIYTISINNYDSVYLQNIVDSLHFF